MNSGDIYGRLIDGKRRRGCLSIDIGQENARVSAPEEGELSSESGTHPNVVLGSIRAKTELYDSKHVFSRKCRDLTLVQILGEVVHRAATPHGRTRRLDDNVDAGAEAFEPRAPVSRGLVLNRHSNLLGVAR